MQEAQQLVGCVQMMILDSKKVNDSAHWEGSFCADPGGSPMRVPHWGLTSMPATHPKTRELVRGLHDSCSYYGRTCISSVTSRPAASHPAAGDIRCS